MISVISFGFNQLINEWLIIVIMEIQIFQNTENNTHKNQLHDGCLQIRVNFKSIL